MDEIDQAIVRLLERHGQLSQEQLARRVRLSRPASGPWPASRPP